jgi:hypothetical protein
MTNAQRQAKFRQRQREQGITFLTVRVRKEDAAEFAAIAEYLLAHPDHKLACQVRAPNGAFTRVKLDPCSSETR